MTTDEEEYHTIVMITDRKINCNQCGRMIGQIIEVDNQEWLQVGSEVGGVIARSCHGVCAACGAIFNWHMADQMLSELVQKVLQMRKSML